MTFCQKCHLVVAPYAADRVHTPHGVFHSACYTLWMAEHKTVKPLPEKVPVRTFMYRGKRPITVSR